MLGCWIKLMIRLENRQFSKRVAARMAEILRRMLSFCALAHSISAIVLRSSRNYLCILGKSGRQISARRTRTVDLPDIAPAAVAVA